MARAFDDGSNQYLINGNAAVTVTPLTLAAWVFTDSLSVSQDILSVGNAATTNFFRIALRTTSDLAEAQVFDGGAGDSAFSTTSYSANTWHHICGVFTSSSSRSILLDGGSKGTQTDTRTPTGVDGMRIGLAVNDTQPFSGNIAEAAIWGAALTDAEAAILALGYSPLLVRPQSLVAHWPLIGRTSPEIDIVGGYDMTLTNGPTTAPHPPVIYPSQQIYTIQTQGATTMGRMYSVSNTVAGVTAAIDLVRISAPTDAVVVLHKIVVTQETEFADAQSEMLDVMIHRGSTDGSGGATPTPSPLEVGDSAFGGTAATGNTTQSTDGTIMHREAWHVAAGFHYPPTPEEKIVLSPSGRIVCSLETAPDDSVDFRVTAYIEEIGG